MNKGIIPNLIPSFDTYSNKYIDDTYFADQQSIGTTIPPVKIYNTKAEFFIDMGLPGAVANDINVGVENGVLTISSNVKENTSNENIEIIEFDFSNFSRSFNLPDNADMSNIMTTYTDGIYHVVIPKKNIDKIDSNKTD